MIDLPFFKDKTSLHCNIFEYKVEPVRGEVKTRKVPTSMKVYLVILQLRKSFQTVNQI
jgi:hypothetical protein